MSIDKKEPIREGSEESMDSTPEAENEIGTATQGNSGVQKRKGGRKPVSDTQNLPRYSYTKTELYSIRFMPHRKSANNAIVKPKLLFENVEPSISNSSKKQSGSMKPTSITYRLLTGVLLMNASC